MSKFDVIAKHNNFVVRMRRKAAIHLCELDTSLQDDGITKVYICRGGYSKMFRLDLDKVGSIESLVEDIWDIFLKDYALDNPPRGNELADRYVDFKNNNYIRVHEPLTIINVIFNEPATIVFWSDGTKTVVKTQGEDEYDPEKGLAMAIAKKYMGNTGRYYNEFAKWLGKYEEKMAADEKMFGKAAELWISHLRKKIMTCREKLAKEYPNSVNDFYSGGCESCPHVYGYARRPAYCTAIGCSNTDTAYKKSCAKCWDRPVEEK